MTWRTLCSLLCCTFTSIALNAHEQLTELNAAMKLDAPGLEVGDIDVRLQVSYSQTVEGPDENGLHRLYPQSMDFCFSTADGLPLLQQSMDDWGGWYLQQFGTGLLDWFFPQGGSFGEPELKGALKESTEKALKPIFEETMENLFFEYLIGGAAIFKAHPAKILEILEDVAASEKPSVNLNVEDQPEGTERSFHLALSLPPYNGDNDQRFMWESFFTGEPVVQVYLDESPLAEYIQARRPLEAVELEVMAMWDEAQPHLWSMNYVLKLKMIFEEDDIDHGSLEFQVQRSIESS